MQTPPSIPSLHLVEAVHYLCSRPRPLQTFFASWPLVHGSFCVGTCGIFISLFIYIYKHPKTIIFPINTHGGKSYRVFLELRSTCSNHRHRYITWRSTQRDDEGGEQNSSTRTPPRMQSEALWSDYNFF